MRYNKTNDLKVIVKHHVCQFHKKNNGYYAGCTCSAIYKLETTKSKPKSYKFVNKLKTYTPF